MTLYATGRPATLNSPACDGRTAIELLDGNDEDRRIALHILKVQLALSDDEIRALTGKSAAA